MGEAVFVIFLAICFFAIYVAITRWLFRINETIGLLRDIKALLERGQGQGIKIYAGQPQLEPATSSMPSPNSQSSQLDARIMERYTAIKKEYGQSLSRNGIIIKLEEELKLSEDTIRGVLDRLDPA